MIFTVIIKIFKGVFANSRKSIASDNFKGRAVTQSRKSVVKAQFQRIE